MLISCSNLASQVLPVFKSCCSLCHCDLSVLAVSLCDLWAVAVQYMIVTVKLLSDF
jgi:hypothetical protein